MKIGTVLLAFFVFVNFSCSVNKKYNTVTKEMPIEFQEIRHINLKLIDANYKILSSQKDINGIYFKINDADPSPRKSPIPILEARKTYVVFQPRIDKNDFEIQNVNFKNNELEVNIKEIENGDFSKNSSPASIIEIPGEIIINQLKYNKN